MQAATIALGSKGLQVSKLGYGCMGLTTAYGTKLPDEEIVSLLEKVYKNGITFWDDTANLYVFPDDPWRFVKLRSPIVCQAGRNYGLGNQEGRA